MDILYFFRQLAEEVRIRAALKKSGENKEETSPIILHVHDEVVLDLGDTRDQDQDTPAV